MSEWIVDPDFGVRPTLPQCPIINIDGVICGGDIEVVDFDFMCGVGITLTNGDYDMCDHYVNRRCTECDAHLCEDCANGNITNR